MADLFISHATPNRAQAEKVRAAQTERGISCWMATEEIHTGKYAASINEAISKAKAVAVIVSAEAEASHHVEREVALAVERKILILPLAYGRYRPTGALEYYLSGLQYIDGSQFEEAMQVVADAVRGAAPSKPRPEPIPRRDLDFFAVLSAVAAILAAVIPFPVAAAARIAMTVALLIFPMVRALKWSRTWRPLRRAAVLLFLLLFCGWTLDRAALQSVIRRKLEPARATFYAPYGNIQDLHQRVPPNMVCKFPTLPADANLYNWGGPESAIDVVAFSHPEVIEIECPRPFSPAAVKTTTISGVERFELWNYELYGWIRWLFIVIGGLSWSGSLYFWRRSPPSP